MVSPLIAEAALADAVLVAVAAPALPSSELPQPIKCVKQTVSAHKRTKPNDLVLWNTTPLPIPVVLYTECTYAEC